MSAQELRWRRGVPDSEGYWFIWPNLRGAPPRVRMVALEERRLKIMKWIMDNQALPAEEFDGWVAGPIPMPQGGRT